MRSKAGPPGVVIGNLSYGNINLASVLEQWKRAEVALLESEAKSKALIETSACAIFIYQGEKSVYANPRGEALTG